MSDKNPLYDNIRDAFEGQAPKAPEGLWEGVAASMESDGVAMDTRVQEAFESTSNEAPEAVWMGVRQQLNIDQAWTGIRLYLKRRILWLYARDFGIATLALLLLWWSWPGNLGLDNVGLSQNGPENNVEASVLGANEAGGSVSTSVPEEKGAVESNDNLNAGLDDEDDSDPVTEPGGAIAVSGIQNGGEEAIVAVSANEDQVVDQSPNNNDGAANLGTDQPLVASFEAENQSEVPEHTSKDIIEVLPRITSVLGMESIEPTFGIRNAIAIDSSRRIAPLMQVGVIADISHTRILDAEFRNGKDPNSLISNRWSHGHGYGLYASVPVSHRSEFEAQLYWNSSVADARDLYIHGTYTHKEVTLNYMKAAVMYNRLLKLNPFEPKGSRIVLSGGLYAAQLRDKAREHDSRLVSISDNYTVYDFGLKFSVGQQHTIKSFSVSYGLQLEQGVANIFAGSESFPRGINVTSTRRTGLFLSVGKNF